MKFKFSNTILDTISALVYTLYGCQLKAARLFPHTSLFIVSGLFMLLLVTGG